MQKEKSESKSGKHPSEWVKSKWVEVTSFNVSPKTLASLIHFHFPFNSHDRELLCIFCVIIELSTHRDVLRFTMTFNAVRLSTTLNISQIKSTYPVVLEVERPIAINQDMTQSLTSFVSIFSRSYMRIFQLFEQHRLWIMHAKQLTHTEHTTSMEGECKQAKLLKYKERQPLTVSSKAANKPENWAVCKKEFK